MPVVSTICDPCGKVEDLFYSAKVGATEAAKAVKCACGGTRSVDWSSMTGKIRVAFREGRYELGDEKIYCSTKKQYLAEAEKRGLNVRWL